MDYEDLQMSLKQHQEQLFMIEEALKTAQGPDRDSLLSLENDLRQLVELTRESLNTIINKNITEGADVNLKKDDKLDDEYELFMKEMADTGAYDENKSFDKNDTSVNCDGGNIDDELSSLLGMKCAVLHTHKWGGQPSLHNAMVSSIVPHSEDHGFDDIQVRVLFTHPTHAEMLPCPFYLDGDCRFDDEQCRYSHGTIVPLSDLKDAVEPSFESIKVGSRILLKLRPQNNEDISLKKKSTEKYHLWHRAIVKYIDLEKKTCEVKLEQRLQTGEKRKFCTEEFHVPFEDMFPLNDDAAALSVSDDSLSDTEYPDVKSSRSQDSDVNTELLIEKSFSYQGPAMGEWERHTKGIGSKLMLAMGYVPGTGLGASSDGRLQPVEARVLPVGKSLDHCMNISEKAAGQDPLKVEQRLKRIQKKEEERNKRAYEREKEKERRNVFNFLNRTLGDQSEEIKPVKDSEIKQSTSQSLNIEQFKIAEDTKRLEREINKLNSSLHRSQVGTEVHKALNNQMAEKNRELEALRSRELKIVKEQQNRKDKHKMTVF